MCATGLRHAPTFRRELSQISPDPSRTEARAQDAEAIADAPERLRVRGFLHPELELIGPARLADQALLGALEREPLLVEQSLDALHELEIARAVQPLTRRILLRAEQLELRLPVAKDVSGDTGDRLHLTDTVVELFCDFRRHAVTLIRCLSPLLGLKVSTLRAVISIDSPVCGFRPRRDALRRMRKWPKPTIFTSSPFSKQRKMMSNTDSTTEDDCRFESPWLATALTRSFFVTVGSHLPLGTRRDAPGRPRRSLPASRDEGRVALLLQLAEGRRRGGLVLERTDAHAIQGAVARRGRSAARGGRRGRRRRAARGATDLHLEAIDREILRERDRIAQRPARPDDHHGARRLRAEPLRRELGVDVRGRAAADVHVVPVGRRCGGGSWRRARRRAAGGLHAARRRLLDVVLLLAQPHRELLGGVGILERADLHEVVAARAALARRRCRARRAGRGRFLQRSTLAGDDGLARFRTLRRGRVGRGRHRRRRRRGALARRRFFTGGRSL